MFLTPACLAKTARYTLAHGFGTSRGASGGEKRSGARRRCRAGLLLCSPEAGGRRTAGQTRDAGGKDGRSRVQPGFWSSRVAGALMTRVDGRRAVRSRRRDRGSGGRGRIRSPRSPPQLRHVRADGVSQWWRCVGCRAVVRRAMDGFGNAQQCAARVLLEWQSIRNGKSSKPVSTRREQGGGVADTRDTGSCTRAGARPGRQQSSHPHVRWDGRSPACTRAQRRLTCPCHQWRQGGLADLARAMVRQRAPRDPGRGRAASGVGVVPLCGLRSVRSSPSACAPAFTADYHASALALCSAPHLCPLESRFRAVWVYHHAHPDNGNSHRSTAAVKYRQRSCASSELRQRFRQSRWPSFRFHCIDGCPSVSIAKEASGFPPLPNLSSCAVKRSLRRTAPSS